MTIDGQECKTVEHYFQAQKFAARTGASSHDEKMRTRIRGQIVAAATAGETKNLALKDRDVAVPWETWKTARIGVMYTGVYAKFSQDDDLKAMLLATGNAQLIETMPPTRYDTFWGVKDDTGANMLGQILMRVREDLRDDRHPDPNENFIPDPALEWRTSP